ncbi:MAG: HAMP domain-containing histidine kinase, partial [Actinomycetota bacterium]|nr:HAMP domain-containing histidine kinase [Actinomycetota bacterium]
RQARAALAEAAGRLTPAAGPAQLADFAAQVKARTGFEVVAVRPDGTSETTSVSLSARSVPAGLGEALGRGRVTVVRATAAGTPYVVAGGRLPGVADLFFFSPIDDVAEDLRVLRNVLAGVGATLVVLSGLVGAVAARGLLTPIRRARTAAHRLEVGLLETRLPEEGRDELADLAHSFNAMAGALERTVGELRVLEAGQRRFVSDVSHELRTPLTALTTAADVLEANAGGLNDAGRRAARVLVVEARRLRALVADLMEISRLDAGAPAMAWEAVDMATVVRAAVVARGWHGRAQLDLEPGVTTWADPRRLDAIVGNLVGNAFEHGAPPVRVTVSATDDAAHIEVADGGAGIPPEHLGRVFDRFYKADPARARTAAGGSGLGLAIARENARLHGGDVTVTSPPGGGAVFTVTLPKRSAPPDGTPVTDLLPGREVAVTTERHDAVP